MFKGRRNSRGRAGEPRPAASGESRAAIPGNTKHAEARLLWNADALLVLVTQLRATSHVSDLGRLRDKVAGLLLDFQASARADGIEAARVAQATEVLAALIDHVVTSMPWGADAGWHSLGTASALSSGRRPAQRLLEVARASSSDAGLGELIGVALLLGFDKRSRGEDELQIDQVLTRLAPDAAARSRPPPESKHGAHPARDLSPQWRSAVARGGSLTRYLPLWVSSLVMAALLAVLFLTLQLSLGARSDQLYARLAALNGPAGTTRPAPAPNPRLAGALSAQVAALNMFVRDEIDRTVIVVPDAKLFEAGSPTLRPAGSELLRQIAAALRGVPGRIQVIGHTDGSLARSARYPSDWEFSVDRARAVQEALRDLGIDAARLAYDGRANIEPLRADDQARALSGNGRIEIVLLAGR